MTPEQWHRVKEVFEAALDRAPEERSGFLGQACAGDDLLHSEVKSLLSSYEQEKSFMDTPAASLAAESLMKEESNALVGQQLGHYQIIRELGRGGMGVVYLAQDTTLDRPVALKLLPSYLTSDPERLRRFEREARSASALNHPNILTIYEIGQEDALHFIATEFIDGVTLREKIKRKDLNLNDALRISEQIASALAAAHAAGIVHRDIKPENVMLRRDGYVKVLDFGLAKLTEARSASVAAISTAAVAMDKDTGIAGTAGYMSPEQAGGEQVDQRSDIFSCGAVLYEMLTGEMAFRYEWNGEPISVVVHREPAELSNLGENELAEVERVLRRCLEKKPEERYASGTELVAALKEMVILSRANDGVPSAARTPPRTILKHGWWLALTIVAMLTGSVWLLSSRRGGVERTVDGWRSTMKVVPLTGLPSAWNAAFSPDGKHVAFLWNSEGKWPNDQDVYVKLVDGGTPTRLTFKPATDASPVWSPDGNFIAFTRYSDAERAIFTIPASGGPERKLFSTQLVSPTWGPAGIIAWSRDNFIVYSNAGTTNRSAGLYRLSVDKLETKQLTMPPEGWFGDQQPAISPDGKTLAFVRMSGELVDDVYVMPAAGGEPTRLTFDNATIHGLAWMPDGRSIVFSSGRSGGLNMLWRISSNGGKPEPLGVGGDQAYFPAISDQGQHLAYVSGQRATSFLRVELPNSPSKTSLQTKILSSTSEEYLPQISTDGKRIVFVSRRSGIDEIWACDSDGSKLRQLTGLGRPLTGTPRWSPDGEYIAFDARLEEQSDIYVITAGGGQPQRVTKETASDEVPSWSRDGKWIYFASNRSGAYQVWKTPAEGGESVQVTKAGGFAAFESPDGKDVYYS